MRSERKAEIKSVSFPQDRDRYRMEGSWHTIMGDKNKKDSELEAYHEKNTKVDGTSEYTCRGTEFSDCGRACRTGRSIFANDTYRDLCVATKTNYVEILNFRHFFKHIVFTSEGDKIRNKEIKNYINVSVVVDIECGNTNN